MPIAILLRRDTAKNIFRNVIINTISAGGVDEVLICSGFFQENRRSSYRATLEGGLGASLASSKIKCTTVGIHNYQWMQSYRDFKAGLIAAGVNAHCKYRKGTKWHAKVFIALHGGVPRVGIIGSSNITRPAFSTTSPFNRECDVVLWSENTSSAPALDEAFENDDPSSIIRAPYIQNENGNLTVEDRLLALYDEVLSDGLVDL